jgi:hypothetical protein
MQSFKTKFITLVAVSMIVFLIIQSPAVFAEDLDQPPDDGQAQQPTVAVPTVTGTATGPTIIVYADPEEQINVRSGPGTDYPRVGVLLNRQEVPALGRTPAGDWVEIIYQGVEEGVAWVYAPLVRIQGGELPIVEPPPTPTPRVTPTIDPTLASQFVVQIPATRMPTLTPPPPLVIPTFQAEEAFTGTGGIPIGFVIIGTGMFGILGLLLSFLRRG